MRQIRMRKVDVSVFIILFAPITRYVVTPGLHETCIHAATLRNFPQWVRRAENALGTWT